MSQESNVASIRKSSSITKEYVKDVMNPDPHVISEDETLMEAAKLMVEYDCGFLIVVSETGRATGVITDRDIVVFGIARELAAKETVIKDVMTRDIITCYQDEPLEMAADHISENDIRRLVVLDKEEELAGVVSLVDMIKHVEDDTINIEVIRHLFKYA